MDQGVEEVGITSSGLGCRRRRKGVRTEQGVPDQGVEEGVDQGVEERGITRSGPGCRRRSESGFRRKRKEDGTRV